VNDSYSDSSIRVIAVCVIKRDGAILVFEGFDTVKGSAYYRPLGGGVEPGETTQQAVLREIREEIDQDIVGLRALGTIENIFTLEGNPGHEIVFVFEGRFANEAAYEAEEFTVREGNGITLQARWRPMSFFNDHHRLVPEELAQLLQDGSR